jgi:hypothetical protein
LSLNKSDITQIKSLIKSEFNNKLKDLVSIEVKKAIDDHSNDDEIREIVAKTMLKFYKVLFYKRTYWYNEIKKK